MKFDHRAMDPINNQLSNIALNRSYFNILIYFAQNDFYRKDYIFYIHNWGKYLKISNKKLESIISNPNQFQYTEIFNRYDALEELFNIVIFIYLDKKVEDIEIEILMKYAEKLGFPGYIVGDIVKSILAAPYDGSRYWQLKEELTFLLKSLID